jgi:hypothetical protein
LAAQNRAELQRREALAHRPVPARRGLQAGIEKVDLENKVQADVFSRALKSQRDRISGNEYALATTSVMDELKKTFPNIFDNELGRFFPLASLLLLRPEKKGSGFDALIRDPRFLAPALILGLKLYKDYRGREQDYKIFPGTVKLASATKETKKFYVLDKKGNLIISNVVWSSSDNTNAPVDPATGQVTATAKTDALITATVDINGVTSKVSVPVEVT